MFLPNIDPYSFTGTAVILGYLLTTDFTIEEQAALGAWFNVVGDILASNSAWLAVLQLRESRQDDNKSDDIDTLNKAIDKIKEELEKLKENDKG